MSGGVIGKFIYFWAFMIGVIIFGKIFGFMNDTKTSVIILVAAAVIYAKKKKKEEGKEQTADEA